MICARCARDIPRDEEPHDGMHNLDCPRLNDHPGDDVCWCQTATVHAGCCEVCNKGLRHPPLKPVEPAVASLAPFAWVGLPACPPEDAA